MKLGFLLAPALALSAAAPAQTTAAPASRGGLGSLLGGALPSMSGVGVGNAAGLLSYCVRNQLLGPTTGAAGTTGLLGGLATGATATPAPMPTAAPTAAQGVLDRLLGRQGVRTSPGFTAGQAGRLQLGSGANSTLPVAGLQDQVKSRLCSAVLNRARSFL